METITIERNQKTPENATSAPTWEQKLREEARYNGEYEVETNEGIYKVEIEPSEDYEDPRDWDNLGTIIYWHRRNILGDVDGGKKYDQPQEFLDEAIADKYIMLPIAIIDHSGISMYIGRHAHHCDPGGWDSGQVGWIYVTPEKAMEEYGWKRITEARRDKIKEYLTNEVKTFDDYLTGNVHHYTVTDQDENEVDSCSGYFGDLKESGIIDEIVSIIGWDILYRVKTKAICYNNQFNYLKRVIKTKVPLIYRKPFQP